MATTKTKKKAPSSPQDFKKKRKVGILLDLPSGLVMKVKGVDLISLVATGKIPNSLLKTMSKHLDADSQDAEEQTAEKLADQFSSEELSEMFGFMDVLITEMAMEPRVLPVPADEDDRSDDFLYTDEIDTVDKLHLFKWTQEGINRVKPFPGDSGERLVAVAKSGSAEADAE